MRGDPTAADRQWNCTKQKEFRRSITFVSRAACPAVDVVKQRRSLQQGVACFEIIRRWDADDSVFMWGFDLIELNGDDLRHRPISRRRLFT
jgi:hypothetical protein